MYPIVYLLYILITFNIKGGVSRVVKYAYAEHGCVVEAEQQ